MNLLLFESETEGLFLVAEQPTVHANPPDAARTWWTRLRHKVQDGYQKVKDRFDHSERVCGMIRHATDLRVAHGSGLQTAEVEKKLRRFFELRYSKHRRWLAVDVVLAVAGSVLTPLPGPNIFFFYPAVRALAHYFAKAGAERALQLNPQFVPEPLIDVVQANVRRLDEAQAAILELEARYNVEGLGSQLGHLKAGAR